jgi:hypothetical protein
VGPKVPVGANNKKVDILDLGLASLLEKHDADYVGNREQVP